MADCANMHTMGIGEEWKNGSQTIGNNKQLKSKANEEKSVNKSKRKKFEVISYFFFFVLVRFSVHSLTMVIVCDAANTFMLEYERNE